MSAIDLAKSHNDTQFLWGAAVSIVSGVTLLAQAFGLMPNLFSILGPVGEADPAWLPSQSLCAIFLVFHNIRLWFGLTFLDSDASFLRAVEVYEKQGPDGEQAMALAYERHKRIWIVLYGSTASAPFLTPLFGFWGFAVIFFFQAIGLIMLDRNWYAVLISPQSKDKEKAANKFFIIGDVVVGIFAMTLITSAAFKACSVSINSHILSAIFIFLGGALVSLFVGEYWSQYKGALELRWRIVRSRLFSRAS